MKIFARVSTVTLLLFIECLIAAAADFKDIEYALLVAFV